jgi:large subunit ribosomal protein L32e
MNMNKILRLLKLRRKQKSRKPEFRRYEAHKKLRLRDKSWRRPRGRHSKLRTRYGGRKVVMAGYGSPKQVRHLHPSGFEEVIVHNLLELDSVDASRQAIRIASAVGLKKRLAIEEKAKELGLKILNPVQR